MENCRFANDIYIVIDMSKCLCKFCGHVCHGVLSCTLFPDRVNICFSIPACLLIIFNFFLSGALHCNPGSAESQENPCLGTK